MKNRLLHKDIEEALRAERPARKVSEGFADRVIEALPSRPTGESGAPMLSSPQRLWPRLAGAAALAAVAVLGWRQFSPSSPEAPPPVIALAPSVAQPTSLDLNLPPVTVEQVQALTMKLDQPLEKELERVLADTRGAIQFVASNFTP
jgi:hypothetical protein